jgi:two-component system invasion response regulator UvrY
MKILVADDHGVVRRGLKEILADTLPAADILEAADGDEVLRCLAANRASLVVLDLSMPGRSGLDVLADIKHLYPRLPVIIMSCQPEEQYALRCLRAGAAAYISKDAVTDELSNAVRKVMAGGRYIGESLSQTLASSLLGPADRPLHDSLSDRELEVLRLIASGASLTEIAARLHVSVKTVSTYRSRLTEKMQMKSNAELTRYALEHRLVD